MINECLTDEMRQSRLEQAGEGTQGRGKGSGKDVQCRQKYCCETNLIETAFLQEKVKNKCGETSFA